MTTKEYTTKHIYANQTMLVQALLDTGFLDYDVVNMPEEEGYEVFSWYLVSDDMMYKLREHDEIILETEYGSWWGRTTFGQPIYMDAVIDDIVDSYAY